MLNPSCYFLSIAALSCVALSAQIPFKEAMVTQVVGDVFIRDAQTLEQQQAAINSLFKAPDMMETGRRSRAQLTLSDDTITRIGSNTTFSFDPSSRTIDLEKGSLLFNSPTGKGGGTIRTAAATASVIGTTIAISSTANGGFKIMVLEGTAAVDFADGTRQILEAGQMTFVLPPEQYSNNDAAGQGQDTTDLPAPGAAIGGLPGPIFDFDLEGMVDGAALLDGFDEPLPSSGKIMEAINSQNSQIGSILEETGIQILDVSGEANELIVLVTETLDENGTPITYSPEVERLRVAARTPATITNNSYPSGNVFTDPLFVPETVLQEFDASHIPDTSNPYDGVFLGIIASNMTLDGIDYNFDLWNTFDNAVYNDDPDSLTGLAVNFIATEQMTFTGSGFAAELNNKEGVFIYGGTGITIPSNYYIDGFFYGSGNQWLHLQSGAGLAFNGTSFFIEGGSSLELEALGGSITANDTMLSLYSGSADLNALNSVSLTNSNIDANYLKIGDASPDGMRPGTIALMDISAYASTGIDLNALSQITIDSNIEGSYLSASNVNITAPTIGISNTSFNGSSYVNLYSTTGNVIFGNFVPGTGNIYIGANTYHGQTEILSTADINPARGGPGVYTRAIQ